MSKREMYYTTKEVAEQLKLSERTIRNMISEGRLKATRFDDGSLRISELQLASYLELLALIYPCPIPRKRRISIQNAIRQSIFIRDKGICQLCRFPCSEKYFHIDHITPRIKGGKNELANLQLAHPRCNILKGAKSHETTKENSQNYE